MIVKVCGMRDPDNIRAVEQLGIDWMGFVMHPCSPRYVPAPPAYLPCMQKRVGVVVDIDAAEVVRLQKAFGFDVIQLHGGESPHYCEVLRTMLPPHTQLVKMIPVSAADDIGRTADYADVVDYFLFETPTNVYGGSGRKFEWALLEHYTGSVPFIITGGIGPADAPLLHHFCHPMWAGIDLNSRFETEPAVKDPELIRKFLETLND